ncbi:MAG: hypothetical protein GY749_24395 [Desulfobacteraceae bacterium]|nr:hypothetical protein [Desulfobacteraceae bacterium]
MKCRKLFFRCCLSMLCCLFWFSSAYGEWFFDFDGWGDTGLKDVLQSKVYAEISCDDDLYCDPASDSDFAYGSGELEAYAKYLQEKPNGSSLINAGSESKTNPYSNNKGVYHHGTLYYAAFNVTEEEISSLNGEANSEYTFYFMNTTGVNQTVDMTLAVSFDTQLENVSFWDMGIVTMELYDRYGNLCQRFITGYCPSGECYTDHSGYDFYFLKRKINIEPGRFFCTPYAGCRYEGNYYRLVVKGKVTPVKPEDAPSFTNSVITYTATINTSQ